MIFLAKQTPGFSGADMPMFVTKAVHCNRKARKEKESSTKKKTF